MRAEMGFCLSQACMNDYGFLKKIYEKVLHNIIKL